MARIEVSDGLAQIIESRAGAAGVPVGVWLEDVIAEMDADPFPAEEAEAVREAKIAHLRAICQEGMDAWERGEYVTIESKADLEAFMKSMDNELDNSPVVQEVA